MFSRDLEGVYGMLRGVWCCLYPILLVRVSECNGITVATCNAVVVYAPDTEQGFFYIEGEPD